jgi:hypothetical protein
VQEPILPNASALGYSQHIMKCPLSHVAYRRVLMWRRSDNICFALLLSGDDSVSVGERVECKIKGILQVSSSVGKRWLAVYRM